VPSLAEEVLPELPKVAPLPPGGERARPKGGGRTPRPSRA
jgi:hypothetical protein